VNDFTDHNDVSRSLQNLVVTDVRCVTAQLSSPWCKSPWLTS